MDADDESGIGRIRRANWFTRALLQVGIAKQILKPFCRSRIEAERISAEELCRFVRSSG